MHWTSIYGNPTEAEEPGGCNCRTELDERILEIVEILDVCAIQLYINGYKIKRLYFFEMTATLVRVPQLEKPREAMGAMAAKEERAWRIKHSTSPWRIFRRVTEKIAPIVPLLAPSAEKSEGQSM
jgi:hypothetical protein